MNIFVKRESPTPFIRDEVQLYQNRNPISPSNLFITFFIIGGYSRLISRVPTFTGKPGKMRVHLENLEKSWNFAKNNKNHGKITWNLEKYLGRL